MDTAVSVSTLTTALKEVLHHEFGTVKVYGEISSFTAHRSGHWYFVVKDASAVLNCVMFRGANQRVRFRPAVGDQLVLTGGIDVYAPQGRYNLLVRQVERLGDGSLQQKLEALKRKLQAEGLFDPARKRPLPVIPRAIGVATSATGAAFRDIVKVLDRRFPSVPVYLAPCRVQGVDAPAEIIRAIGVLATHDKSEVIIVGRGGGSQEDLAAFNDEAVVRAIAACPIPVVSAVGHEIDVSIADLVADVRAATPSHAAELVVPERASLLEMVLELRARLCDAAHRDLVRRGERVAALKLRDPRRRVADGRLRLDELGDRIVEAQRRDLTRRGQRLRTIDGRLRALSPLGVLERGYAVALMEGRAVRDSAELSPGDTVDLRLHRGSARTEVLTVEADSS